MSETKARQQNMAVNSETKPRPQNSGLETKTNLRYYNPFRELFFFKHSNVKLSVILLVSEVKSR